MTDQDQGPIAVTGWQNLLQEGLPQLIAGPAGRAISRLVAGAVDIPAAWLQQKAQGIRDETSAKSKVYEALASAVAERGAAETELQARALERWLGVNLRKQQNREAVAEKVVEHIAEAPDVPLTDPEGDWMNLFEGKAEQATSERMRDLYARILSGELRKPKSFSLGTLEFVSTLDEVTAKHINTVLPYVFGPGWVAKDLVGHLGYEIFLDLEEAGFLNMGDGNVHQAYQAGDDGQLAIGARDGELFVLNFQGRREIDFPCYPLTRRGRELSKVIVFEPRIDLLIPLLWKFGPQSIRSARRVMLPDGAEAATDLADLPRPG